MSGGESCCGFWEFDGGGPSTGLIDGGGGDDVCAIGDSDGGAGLAGASDGLSGAVGGCGSSGGDDRSERRRGVNGVECERSGAGVSSGIGLCDVNDDDF